MLRFDPAGRLEREVRVISALNDWEVGLSVGAVPIPTDGSRTRQDLLKSSDRLMYATKQRRKAGDGANMLGGLRGSSAIGRECEGRVADNNMLETSLPA